MNAKMQPMPLRLLAIEGPEAELFLHSLLSSDVRALSVEHWQFSALLSPQGRVLGFGPLARTQPERFLWWLPEDQSQSLAVQLRRYLLRRKAKVDCVHEGSICSVAGTGPAAPQPGGALVADDEAIELRDFDAGGRVLLWRPGPADGTEVAAWTEADVASGLPWVCSDASDAFTAHMLTLHRLAAVSLTKGCYPGQEIVARTHYLGRAKRSLYQVSGTGAAPPAGGELELSPSSSGRMLYSRLRAGGWEGLAVLPETAEADAEGVSIGTRFDLPQSSTQP